MYFIVVSVDKVEAIFRFTVLLLFASSMLDFIKYKIYVYFIFLVFMVLVLSVVALDKLITGDRLIV